MMLTNKFENYQRGGGGGGGVGNGSGIILSPTSATVACANDLIAAASKAERESIHSGQFMVSHFEAEEAQDDLDDSEVKMLDPEDPSLSKPDEPNPCMEVQLYVPRIVSKMQRGTTHAAGLITSHLEIETSLTKLFKCMNLAYSQKLTSPKWNHFKGVRLRWKDKIRLNNVIWRCWHMQFILKRRTPVCQFASPLDVDIHSNPQSVVLEGKYWKRQLAVIQAEYRKWRRNYKSKATGCLTYDTKSEFDFLEWSPLNDRNLMLSEDWTSDTLFSAINGPFPFPDRREIARGAGIADFIQPSLGPLQPNLDDIDITFAELLQNSRLPPVPEEGAEDMLKNVDYGFSAIMGSEQMDSSNVMDITTNNMNQLQSNDDANMLELNTPLNTLQFSDIEQHFAASGGANVNLISNSNTSSNGLGQAMITEERTTVLLPEAATANSLTQIKHETPCENAFVGRQVVGDFHTNKSVIKGRIAKNFQRPFRREPHNYDKAQPTLHQTTIYQQMLAEQQKSQQQTHQHQHLQPNLASNTSLQHHAATFHQQSLHYTAQQSQYPQSSPTLLSNNANYGYNSDPTTTTIETAVISNNMLSLANSKPFGMLQPPNNMPPVTQSQQMVLNVKIEPPSDVLSMFNLTNNTNDFYATGNQNNSYKPYPSVTNFKKSASTGGYINMRGSAVNQGYMSEQTPVTTQHHVHTQSLPLTLSTQLPALSNALQRQALVQSQLSPTSSQLPQQQLGQQQQHQQQLQGQQQTPHPMLRSNSLPLNVSLHKLEPRLSHDNFAVPKYHAKSSKSRSRSNSIHQHMVATTGANTGTNSNLIISQQLQAATSDPMLNSTLAQLLTTNNKMPSLLKQQSSSTSAITNMNMPLTTSTLPSATVPASNIFMSAAQSKQPAPAALQLSPASTTTAVTKDGLQRQSVQIQQAQKSPKKSTSLPASTSPLLVQNPSNTKMLSYPLANGTQPNCTTNLSLSPESFHDQDSPLSPTHSLKFPRDTQRRAGHIHAEQKRRYNIKNGFDMLHSLIPQLQQNPNAKLSKAAMLQKGADHIRHLRSERSVLKEKMEALRTERDALNSSLTHLHSILPANGAPVTRQGTEHVRQLYEQYVRYRSMNDWKFWILGLILEPILSSYTSSVSSASMEELRRTAFLWVDQHCSLIDLRPAVSNKLKYLSMKTDILSEPPSTLSEEVAKAVHNTVGQHPNLHGT